MWEQNYTTYCYCMLYIYNIMFSVTDVRTELYHLLLLYVVYLQYNDFCYRRENRTVPPIVTVCYISTI